MRLFLTVLERNRRGVQATPAGESLMRHARAILAQVEQMRGELRTYATGLKGRIRFLSNTAAIVSYLAAAPPDLSIDLEKRPSFEIVPAVSEEKAARISD